MIFWIQHFRSEDPGARKHYLTMILISSGSSLVLTPHLLWSMIHFSHDVLLLFYYKIVYMVHQNLALLLCTTANAILFTAAPEFVWSGESDGELQIKSIRIAQSLMRLALKFEDAYVDFHMLYRLSLSDLCDDEA